MWHCGPLTPRSVAQTVTVHLVQVGNLLSTLRDKPRTKRENAAARPTLSLDADHLPAFAQTRIRRVALSEYCTSTAELHMPVTVTVLESRRAAAEAQLPVQNCSAARRARTGRHCGPCLVLAMAPQHNHDQRTQTLGAPLTRPRVSCNSRCGGGARRCGA